MGISVSFFYFYDPATAVYIISAFPAGFDVARNKFLIINSHAVGMAVTRPLGFEIDFVRNPISESAALFFVMILKFILTPILEMKLHEKKFLDTKKISFSKPDFMILADLIMADLLRPI